MLKVEFHAHTNYIQSKETNYSPKELIDRVKELGYDVLCITEHYFVHGDWPMYQQYPFKTYEDFKDYAKKKGILLIRGVELMFKEGEVVLVNYHGDLSEIKELKDLKQLPKETLILAPHPFFFRGICLGKHLEKNIGLFDAIEWGCFYLKNLNRNLKAEKVAKKYGKPMLGTSDAHLFCQLNHSYTFVDAKKDANEIVKAVKQGKVKIISHPLPLHIFTKILVRYSILTAYGKTKHFIMTILGRP